MRSAWYLCIVLSVSAAAAQPRITGVVNGASFFPPVAPGSFATAAVQDLPVAATAASAAALPLTLGGVSAAVNGVAAPLYYVSATQINFQVPRNTPAGMANLIVRYNNTNSAPYQFPVAAAAPGILAFGSNQAVAQHPDGTLITPQNPISVGDVAVIYLTGIGPVDNPANDGVPTPYPPLATATAPSSVTVGGAAGELLFLGLTPGFVGLAQANVRIPDLAPGDYPVVLTVGGKASVVSGPVLSVTRGPLVTLSSGSVTIDPGSKDGFTFQGDFRGLSLDGAQEIAFEVGQFAAHLPAGEFTRQAGSNVLTYQDASGMSPYWIKSLTIDPDARTFTAHAEGIALSGLPNPFAVHFGVDDAVGCTMARMQRTGTTTYDLNHEAAAETPCFIDEVHLGQALAGAAAKVKLQASVQPAIGLDASSVRVYRVNESAQPVGNALCTLAAQPDGSYSCELTINEPQATVIPLVVQASAGSRTLLSRGFALYVVSPGTVSDDAQLDAVRPAVTSASGYFDQFGNSPHASMLAIAELRKLFPAQQGLTGAAVGLSLDGVSVDVRLDSGLRITILRNRSAEDGAAPLAAAALAAKAEKAQPRAMEMAAALPRGMGPAGMTGMDRQVAAESLHCGDFQRDVVWNQEVLLWSADKLFFNYDPEDFLIYIRKSKCPMLHVKLIDGSNADPASLSKFAEYGTVIISSHGGEGYGDGELITGSTDYGLVQRDRQHLALTVVDYYTTGADGKAVEHKGGIFVSVLAGSSYFHQQDKTLFFGAFCYSALLANSFVGNSTAFFGYSKPTKTSANRYDTDRLFPALLNEYKRTGEYAGVAKLQGNGNLAYTGNPKLTAPKFGEVGPFPVTQNEPLSLEAKLEGTEKCDGVMQLHWKTPGLAGTLRPAKNGSGVNNYTAADVDATYTALGAGGATSDQVMVDFRPNAGLGIADSDYAARACATVAPGKKEVAVDLTGVFNYSDEGPHDLKTETPPFKVTMASPFNFSDTGLGGKSSVKVEQTGSSTWKMTQEIASPSRTDIFTQTWNRVDLLLTNNPGPLQIKIHVDVNITGPCQGVDARFTGYTSGYQIDEGNDGCKDSWDFQVFSWSGQSASLFSIRASTLGAKGSDKGAATGTITTTMELLDSSDPFLP